VNRLKPEKQEMVLNLLVEGNAIRGTQRITGVNRRTIIRLIRETGERCQQSLDERMRNIHSKRMQCDEIWTYVAKKQKKLKPHEKNGEFGDQYVFIAIDADTKLIPCFLVGKRNEDNAFNFIQELQRRTVGRFQLTTDAFNGYKYIDTIGFRKRVDYAQLIKIYHGNGNNKKEGYSPCDFIRLEQSLICGNPEQKHISTSYIERQNLTIRTQMRRFTRLTNAFSKKLDCLKAALAIHFWHYNFMRIHRTLRVTPAMESGITSKILTWNEVLI